MCVERVLTPGLSAGRSKQGSWVRSSHLVVHLRLTECPVCHSAWPPALKLKSLKVKLSHSCPFAFRVGACPPLVDHTSHLHGGLRTDLTPTHYGIGSETPSNLKPTGFKSKPGENVVACWRCCSISHKWSSQSTWERYGKSEKCMLCLNVVAV